MSSDIDFSHGSKTVGTSAVQLSALSVQSEFGFVLKAGPTNTGTVYVGKSGVTANTAEATDGIPLEAGDSLEIEINDLNKLWAIATAAGQKLFWLGV